jgi:hypothetical protein
MQALFARYFWQFGCDDLSALETTGWVGRPQMIGPFLERALLIFVAKREKAGCELALGGQPRRLSLRG